MAENRKRTIDTEDVAQESFFDSYSDAHTSEELMSHDQ
jgi:hypothetical protein